MLWILGALLTGFYILNVLHGKELQIRQIFNTSYDQARWYIRHSADISRELQFIAENRLHGEDLNQSALDSLAVDKTVVPHIYPLNEYADCSAVNSSWQDALKPFGNSLNYWQNNFANAYELNRIFFVGEMDECLVDFDVGTVSVDLKRTLKLLNERILLYRNNDTEERKNNLFWIASTSRPGVGYYYMITPVYITGNVSVLLGTEQTVRMEDFIAPGNIPVTATLVDENGQSILSSSRDELTFSPNELPNSDEWFGYVEGYDQLVMKKNLQPSSLNIVYSIPTHVLIEHIKPLIINALFLNLFSALCLVLLAWMLERRMFLPAEANARQLEENEQFNRKIVASAPVGICILRTSDGTNILSNELAHNYLNILTQEDRLQLTEIICGQKANLVDVLTASNTNLQISFVHSRYRNENVAICVLVDVSARVKMEESLQEVAQAAEQASQSKSMFLATVSHELRTPLYGIIGNLDLLQTKDLPQSVESLVAAMNNSSSLLLKIISDILDFSKMESEQLKIEPQEFSPREVVAHLTANYLAMAINKHLTLWCFVDHNVPIAMRGDPVRLQQVLSNLLSNAIKFTHTGGITLHVYLHEGYLTFRIRDTGVGIATKELYCLFDPFFQVGNGVQRNFQGTGLGLAICEKLINMMDGDIAVDSEPGMGSQFVVRIPLYNSQIVAPELHPDLQDKICWLAVRNDALADFLRCSLRVQGVSVQCGSGEYGVDDVVITDYDFQPQQTVRAIIRFDSTHNGAAQEIAAGEWIYSTVIPHELVALLGQIYRINVSLPGRLSVAAEHEHSSVNNEDILVLIVDDHPINRMLLSDQLGSLGYRVKTAQDGEDALNVVSRNEIDMVLTDVNMPNMDGYLLTQRLRQLGQTLPVIGVTANALAEEKQRCLDAGMDNCLSKPVTMDELRKALAFYAERVRKDRAE